MLNFIERNKVACQVLTGTSLYLTMTTILPVVLFDLDFELKY